MAFRLAAVLRARHAQEDAAKAAVVRARADAAEALQRALLLERDLDRRGVPDVSSAAAFSATMSARSAMAGALRAAIGVTEMANEKVEERMADLTDAAIQRRTLEKLEERHAAARKHAEEKADEKAVDDLTTAAASRLGSSR
jgi:flagellar biosynthesis chaperone FliJ